MNSVTRLHTSGVAEAEADEYLLDLMRKRRELETGITWKGAVGTFIHKHKPQEPTGYGHVSIADEQSSAPKEHWHETGTRRK